MSEKKSGLWLHLLLIWILGAVAWYLYFYTETFSSIVAQSNAAEAAGSAILPWLGAWVAAKCSKSRPKLWAWVVGVALIVAVIAGQQSTITITENPEISRVMASTKPTTMACNQSLERQHAGRVGDLALSTLNREEFYDHYLEKVQAQARTEGKGDIPANTLSDLKKSIDQAWKETSADTTVHLARFNVDGHEKKDICVVENDSCSCLGEF